MYNSILGALLLLTFIFNSSSGEILMSKANESVIGSINRKQREVQLSTDYVEHKSLSSHITTEEKILYAALVLCVLLVFTCCCVCWKYCFCDSEHGRTIIYHQMPSAQFSSFQRRVPYPLIASVGSSDTTNLIQMNTLPTQCVRDGEYKNHEDFPPPYVGTTGDTSK